MIIHFKGFFDLLEKEKNYLKKKENGFLCSSTCYTLFKDDAYCVYYTYCNAYYDYEVNKYVKKEKKSLFSTKYFIEEEPLIKFICNREEFEIDDKSLLEISEAWTHIEFGLNMKKLEEETEIKKLAEKIQDLRKAMIEIT